MKKYCKYIYLLIFILFLTGCGWEDVQKEYGDLLKTEPECTYYKENDDYEDFGIDSLELSADYNGVYAKVNGGSKQTLFGTSNANNFINSNGYQIQFLDSFFEDFLKQYQKNDNYCPERIYIPLDTGHQVRLYDCTDLGYACKTYTLKLPTVTVPDNTENDSSDSKSCYCIPNTNTCGLYRNPRGEYTEPNDMSKCTSYNGENDSEVVLRDCHHSSAIACSKVVKADDQFGNEVYLEFGYYERNGNIKKYFGAADDDSYNNFILDDDESDGFFVAHNIEQYTIPDEAINEIWLSNNKFISKNDLVIKATVATSTIYIITGKNTVNYGDWDNTGEVEDAPDIDQDKIEQNIVITPIKPAELDCDSLLGSPKIQGQPAFYLQIVFDVMKYVAIAIVIIFSILDFTGAVASQDNDAIKKSTKKLIIRLVLCVVIFVLPTILEFVFTLIDVYSPSTCRIN